MAQSPLSVMLEIINAEVKRIKARSDEDMFGMEDCKKLEVLAATYAKIKAEIRTTKKQSIVENKNLEEILVEAQVALETLKNASLPPSQ